MTSETSEYLEQFIREKFSNFLLFISDLENWQKSIIEHAYWKTTTLTQKNKHYYYGYDNSYNNVDKSAENLLENINNLKTHNIKLLKNVVFDWIRFFKITETSLDLQLKNCLKLFQKINSIESKIKTINSEIEEYENIIISRYKIMSMFKKLESPTIEQIDGNSINKNTIEVAQEKIYDKKNVLNNKNEKINEIKSQLSSMSLFWSSFDEEWTKELFEEKFSNNTEELKMFFSEVKSQYLKIFKNLNNEDKLIFDVLKNNEENLKDRTIDDSFLYEQRFKNILEYFDL